MKIIITGSSGFIGTALTLHLKELGNEVVECDYKINRSITALKDNSEYADCVVHLAAQTSVFNTDHKAIERDNISAFIDIVEYANKYSKRFIYASSSCAFTDNQTSLYGLSKAFDESYASMYANNAIGIRFHNVYGKNPRKGTLLYNLENENCTIYNNGKNLRHFTYVDDVIACIKYLITSHNTKLINCYNPLENSVNDFINEFKKYRKPNYRYVSEEKRLDKVQQIVSTTLKKFDYTFTGIEEGLKRIYG